MSATAQNYVYRVKITDEKAMQDKPSISREESSAKSHSILYGLVNERIEFNSLSTPYAE